MQKFEARIEIDEKITKNEKLPDTMILYAVDKEHMVITAKPIKNLEEEAFTKTQVKVISEKTTTPLWLPTRTQQQS
jgi:hypothetical protein